MSTTPAKRKPGRPPVPRQTIIDTALRLVDERGADALTLRALAVELSSSTATLYRHVHNRAELVGLVVDRMLADVELPSLQVDDRDSWDEVCHRTATAIFVTMAEHRKVAPLLIERFPDGPNAILLRERMARALLRAGFSAEVAAKSVAMLGRYILGFSMQADADNENGHDQPVRDAVSTPHLARVAAYLPQPLIAEFDFGLSLMLQGLRNVEVG
ncbi:TetR/AcrR family transcriptional regulator [Microbacterium sp.]|uniref:TetR/AcrR family transcriptional regulator n=1 Tax=Microbacterium sp. TaxID=51671 RepID=UPI003565D8D2